MNWDLIAPVMIVVPIAQLSLIFVGYKMKNDVDSNDFATPTRDERNLNDHFDEMRKIY